MRSFVDINDSEENPLQRTESDEELEMVMQSTVRMALHDTGWHWMAHIPLSSLSDGVVRIESISSISLHSKKIHDLNSTISVLPTTSVTLGDSGDFG